VRTEQKGAGQLPCQGRKKRAKKRQNLSPNRGKKGGTDAGRCKNTKKKMSTLKNRGPKRTSVELHGEKKDPARKQLYKSVKSTQSHAHAVLT